MGVYQRLDKGTGSKGYLHRSLDTGTKLCVKLRTEAVDLEERKKRSRKVENDDEVFKRARMEFT